MKMQLRWMIAAVGLVSSACGDHDPMVDLDGIPLPDAAPDMPDPAPPGDAPKDPPPPLTYDFSDAPIAGDEATAAATLAYCGDLDDATLLAADPRGLAGWYNELFSPRRYMVKTEVTWNEETHPQWVYPCAESAEAADAMVEGSVPNTVTLVTEDDHRYVITLDDDEASELMVLRCDRLPFFSKSVWTAGVDFLSPLHGQEWSIAAQLAQVPVSARALDDFVQYGWWAAAYGNLYVVDVAPATEADGWRSHGICYGMPVFGDFGVDDELQVYAFTMSVETASGIVLARTEAVRTVFSGGR